MPDRPGASTPRGVAADPRLWRFVSLFDEGRWFEAHEVLEALWLDAPADWKDLLQGLVQVAVALEHYRRGNRSGAGKVLARARARLASSDSGARGRRCAAEEAGLDADRMLSETEAYIAGRRTKPPRFGAGSGRPAREHPDAE